jgi:hypothetical protein
LPRTSLKMAPPVPHTPSIMVSCTPSAMVSCTFFRSGAALPLWGVARSTIGNPTYVTEAKRNRAHKGPGSRPATDGIEPSTREPAEPMNQRASPAERGLRAGRGLQATHARPGGGAHPVPAFLVRAARTKLISVLGTRIAFILGPGNRLVGILSVP